MGTHSFRREIVAGLVAGLVGALLAAILVSTGTADAANGDPLYLGRKNYAGHDTLIKGRSMYTFNNTTTGGEPAARFVVRSGPPIEVSSTAMVANLNADLLDGMEASELAASDHDHGDQYARLAGFDLYEPGVSEDGVVIDSDGEAPDYELLSVQVTNDHECEVGTPLVIVAAQAAADIGATSGSAGASSSIHAAVTMDSVVVLDSDDTSYRTRRVWIGADAPQRWALATTGLFGVPPGTHTLRLMLSHTNDGMTVRAFGGSLVVWDLLRICEVG